METKLKVEERLDAARLAVSGNMSGRQFEAKSQYKRLKSNFINLHSKYLLLKSISSGTNLEIDDTVIKKELAECHDTNDRIDKEISETTHSINRLAEQAQEQFEVLNTKREKVRLLTEQLQAKNKKLEAEEQLIRESIAGLPADTSSAEYLSAKAHELTTVTKQVEMYESLHDKWSSELVKLRSERDQQQRAIADKEKELRERGNGPENEQAQQLKQRIDILQTLFALEMVDIQSQQITIRLFNPESSKKGEYVDLTVLYAENKDGTLKISDAKVNIYCLNIGDIVREAVKTSDLTKLVINVRALWLRSYRLLHEVETLRDRFALDWLPDVGHVTVLYDGVMCTLSVTSEYPAAGSIALIKVSDNGLQHITDIAQAKPQKADATLTDWLVYLGGMFKKC